jgi:hypothetical protein
MLALHDRTRRRIALTLFMLLGLAPTAVVLAYGLARHLPGHARSVADRLSLQLGLKTSLSSVEYVCPGVVRYRGMELADAESGKAVIVCRTVLATESMAADNQGVRRPKVDLATEGLEIESTGLASLGRLLEQSLATRSDDAPEIRLTAQDVLLRRLDGPTTLTTLEACLSITSAGPQAEANLRIAGLDSSRPIWIGLGRDRRSTPPESGFCIDTGETLLPCSLLALGLPYVDEMGPRCCFSGRIGARRSAQGYRGDLSGRFVDVDLDRLVTERFPHRLSGTAELALEIARFEGGRLREAAGTVTGGAGQVSTSLLDSMTRSLGLATSLENHAPALLGYETLRFAFLLDQRGLQLRGHAVRDDSGAILVDRWRVLLGDPARQPQPLAALFQALAPADALQVPATRETDQLLRLLPLAEPISQGP